MPNRINFLFTGFLKDTLFKFQSFGDESITHFAQDTL